MSNESQPQLHALSAVSARTALSRSSLYREIKAGRLRALKVGKALRITEAELCRFISALETSQVS